MAYIVSILESFLGECRGHNEDSGQTQFDCPMCENGFNKGNLEINYNKNIFKCWVCKDINNMHGSVYRLIKKYGTHKNLRDYKLFKPDVNLNEDDKAQLTVSLPESFKLLKDSSPKDNQYNEAISYLRKRGITDNIIESYNIGYTTTGTYYNRIIIPSYDEDGILNYFIARWFSRKYNKLKYINPSVDKKTIVFNEHRINWDETIYLVEGATDHIVVPNSIPLLGKYIDDTLIEKLHDKASGVIVILLDSDALEDAVNLYNRLNFGKLRGRLRICSPINGEDPSSIHQKYGKLGIISLLKTTHKI